MLFQNLKDKKFKEIPAHGGTGLIHMKFFHQEFQRFREIDDLPKPNSTYKKSNWNFITYAELPIGSTIAEHLHQGNDEFYMILDGLADMTVDGEIARISKGEVILTRGGSSHAITKVYKKLKFYAIEVLQDDK